MHRKKGAAERRWRGRTVECVAVDHFRAHGGLDFATQPVDLRRQRRSKYVILLPRLLGSTGRAQPHTRGARGEREGVNCLSAAFPLPFHCLYPLAGEGDGDLRLEDVAEVLASSRVGQAGELALLNHRPRQDAAVAPREERRLKAAKSEVIRAS